MSTIKCPGSGLDTIGGAFDWLKTTAAGWEVQCPACHSAVNVRRDSKIGDHRLRSMKARERAAKWLYARRQQVQA